MKTYWPDFCIIFVATLLLAACKPDLEKELCKAESLSAMHPDSTFAILGNINRNNIPDDKCRQLYDLAWAEAYYIKTRTVPDSIDRVLSCMETTPGTHQHLAKKILHSIYLYRHGDAKEALASFDACRYESDTDIHPYWKAVVEDYLGISCLRFGLLEQCRDHFYKVLEYAQLIGDKDVITNAYSHLSAYYRSTEYLDTALYFASKVVEECDRQDSQMVAIAYNNLASIQMAISTEQCSDILNTLHMSLSFNEGSMHTYGMMARMYYSLGKPDSAYIYQVKVDRGNHDYAKYNLYRFLYDYYRQASTMDSAYKYLRLYSSIALTLQNNKPIEYVLNTIHRHDKDEMARNTARQRVWIIIAFVFILLPVAALFFFSYKAKIARADHMIQEALAKQEQNLADVEQEKQSAITELDSVREQLYNTRSELQDSKNALADADKRAEGYQNLIRKRNTQLAHAKRILEDNASNMKSQSNNVVRNLLDKSVSLEPGIPKKQIIYLISSYKESGKHRQQFVNSLLKYADKISPTGMLICILYNEGFTDDEIIAKLQTTSQNFRSAKYRTSLAIKNSGNEPPAFLEQLLAKFERNK